MAKKQKPSWQRPEVNLSKARRLVKDDYAVMKQIVDARTLYEATVAIMATVGEGEITSRKGGVMRKVEKKLSPKAVQRDRASI
jgi:hypothetical protein